MKTIRLGGYDIRLPEKKLGDCGCKKKKKQPTIVINTPKNKLEKTEYGIKTFK